MIPAGTDLGAVQVELVGAPVIGRVAPGGQHVKLGKLEGWWDSPATTGTVTQKVNGHGAFLGPAFYGPRILNAEARVDGFGPGDSLAVARQIVSALSVDVLNRLYVTDELGTLQTDVRQEGDPVLVRSGNRMIVSLSMIAPDPRRYGSLNAVSTGLPVSMGGFTLPITLPVSTGGTSVDGTLFATNEGDIETPGVFIVLGPVPAGTTITAQDGSQLVLMDAVDAGRQLVIDTGARTSLLDGVAHRTVTGTWPIIRPGVNQFLFNASAYAAGAQLSLTYRSAWR